MVIVKASFAFQVKVSVAVPDAFVERDGVSCVAVGSGILARAALISLNIFLAVEERFPPKPDSPSYKKSTR